MLIRGKPCSGKTTLANNIKDKNSIIIDPDNINTRNKEYINFKPRQNKNPTENIKRYCYLFKLAEYSLLSKKNVIWTQPWSRLAEIDLTIRNFGFYFTNLKGRVWKESIDKILNLLPFYLLVLEIDIPGKTSLERYNKQNNDIKDIKRLMRTIKYFQKYILDTPYIKIDGRKNTTLLSEESIDFVWRILHPHKKNPNS